MAQQKYIKDLYENEELSLREISRRTGCCFETVQKYAYKEDWSEDDLPNVEPENYPLLEAYIPKINEWLEADRKVSRSSGTQPSGFTTGCGMSADSGEVIPA